MTVPYFQRKAFAFLLLLLYCFGAAAQKQRPDPSVAHLYQADYKAVDYKIYREHIPLDGDSVTFVPYRKDSLYGFVDRYTGKMVIDPKFLQVFAVYPEGAVVQIDAENGYVDGYGLVNYEGQFLIQPAFRNLFREGDLYHGLFHTTDTAMAEPYGGSVANYYFDKKGNLLFAQKAHEFGTFNEGDSLAWFRYGTSYFIYNDRGKMVKQFAWNAKRSFLGIFRNTLVEGVEEGDHFRYTGRDVKGRLLFELPWEHRVNAVFRIHENMFGMLSEEGLSLSGKDGNPYPFGISNDWYGNGFRYIFPLLDGLRFIPVQDEMSRMAGYIAGRSKQVVPCKYRYAGYYHDGLAPYMDSAGTAVGFMNEAQQPVVPAVISDDNISWNAETDQELCYSEGLCRVKVLIPEKDDKGRVVLRVDERGESIYHIAYLDLAGAQKILLPDSIHLAGDFHDGLAAVVSRAGALGFIDTTGSLVIPMKYEMAVAGAYPFPRLVIPEFRHGFAYLKAFKGYIDKNGKEYFSGRQVKDHYDFSH